MAQGSNERPSLIPGVAIAGSLLCGLAGVICGLIAILAEADFVGGGVCLIAGAVSFGLLAGAVLRA